MKKNELRLIDANLNRLREGIRVIEDIYRFIYDDKSKAQTLKILRHKCRINLNHELLDSRDIINDVLKESTSSEQIRGSIESILIANFKRAQESSRVLEEFTKLINSQNSEIFKNIRYELYDLEKTLTALKP